MKKNRNTNRALKLLSYLKKKRKIDDQMPTLIETIDCIPSYISYSYRDFSKYGKLGKVEVKKLKTSQYYISSKILEKKIKNEWEYDDPEIPYIIVHKGEYYLEDGNHRANKSKILRKKYMKALILRFDSNGKMIISA